MSQEYRTSLPHAAWRSLLLASALFFVLALPGCASRPVSNSALPSQLIETDDLATARDLAFSIAEKFGPENVLVVFDIDNTLLAMEQDLGSDQWYDWQEKLRKENPCDARVVGNTLAAQGALYAASAMRPTQPDTADIVRSIQDRNFRVIALTSRGPDYQLATFRELRRSGISFHDSALGPLRGYPDSFVPDGGSRAARYEDGVFLTAGQDKGVMLQALLAKTGTSWPTVVVMADDKPKNLNQVLAAFAGTRTSIQAIHYTREDAAVARFDPASAAKQWEAVKPALLQLQSEFGPDNFNLPADTQDKSCPEDETAATIRIATFNVSMGLAEAGALATGLQQQSHPQLKQMAEILQRVRPDVILLNEFDLDLSIDAAALLNRNYLGISQGGQPPIEYRHHFRAPVNTGVDSSLDLDGNGKLGTPEDAWGYGTFPGQYGMLVLSRFPIEAQLSRTWQNARWSELTNARRPVKPDGSAFHSDAVWQALRLSSKSHWDLLLDVNGEALHLLAFHPTPPVFDGPEDRNGLRNFDEIRLWGEYLRNDKSDFLADDKGNRSRLPNDARFVMVGDYNADPLDGDTVEGSVNQLLDHPRIDASCQPRSDGGLEAAATQGGLNRGQTGDPAMDTSDFNDEHVGNLRLDYVLPSRGLDIAGCGVFWPSSHTAEHALLAPFDHRLVWLDLNWKSAAHD